MALVAAAAYGYVLLAGTQTHQHDATTPAALQMDSRQLVKLPEPMRLHTITSMRDHLLALQKVDVAPSRNEFDKAASVAEHGWA